MNIKEKLTRLAKKLTGTYYGTVKMTSDKTKKSLSVDETNETIEENSPINKTNEVTIDLDDKVDEFIEWYYENIVKENYTEIGEYNVPKRMRNLIEKIAVWYELRYPKYEVNRLMHCCGQELIEINDVMFKNNPYINDLLGENSEVRELDWDEFFNTNVFMKSLTWEEKCYLAKPRYEKIVYLLFPYHSGPHLHLTRNGFVDMAEGITAYTNSVIKDEELKGLNIKDVVKLFREKGIELALYNGFDSAIQNVEKLNYLREGILNCAMYRIIERGGNRIGPRRGFMFAKEFKRNIDIPMMYGIDKSDPGIRTFINEYIKAGGSKDLKCYVGYFSRKNKDDSVGYATISDLILTLGENAARFYTKEEDELHQRLVNILLTQVDQETVKKEEIKRLRIERKIEKSRKR